MQSSDSKKAISRRTFCKAGAAALAMLAMPRILKATALTDESFSGRCKVKVIRRHCFCDLLSSWADDPDSGPCALYKEGQEIVIVPERIAAFDRGEGICPLAWNALRPAVTALLGSGTAMKPCNALSSAAPSALVCCPDGLRPVVFAVENA